MVVFFNDECPRSNSFIVTYHSRIVTPAENILKGVIRTKLTEIEGKNFKVEERELGSKKSNWLKKHL